MANGSLVQVETADKLYLHGYFSPNSNTESVLLHIHGFEGNFYENWFIHKLAEKFTETQTSFLSVNTRGNGKEADFNTPDGKIKTIGGQYELLEEAYIDIDAWVKYLLYKGYKKIYLCGHSLGTKKVVRYLFEGQFKKNIKKLLLLAPFDQKGELVKNNDNFNYLLVKAKKEVEIGNGQKITPVSDFGTLGVSYRTYVSWYEQDDFGRMFEFYNKDYDFPILKQIKIPTKIIVGSKDEYFYPTNPENFQEAMTILLKNIPISEGKIIEGAVHSFSPHEDLMVGEVVKFLH